MTALCTIGVIPDWHIRDRLRSLSHLGCTAAQAPKTTARVVMGCSMASPST